MTDLGYIFWTHRILIGSGSSQNIRARILDPRNPFFFQKFYYVEDHAQYCIVPASVFNKNDIDVVIMFCAILWNLSKFHHGIFARIWIISGISKFTYTTFQYLFKIIIIINIFMIIL